jgi:hypothetical protein
MTIDVVALTLAEPDAESLRYALSCAGSPRMELSAGGSLLRLLSPRDRTVMTVAAPVRLDVPGEAARLLGTEPAPGQRTLWWTEVRSHLPTAQAYDVAGTFASRLVQRKGGQVWPSHARRTDIDQTVEPGTPPQTAAAQPGVDTITRLTAVILQDRPVIGVSRWLLDALVGVLASDPARTLYLITKPGTRVTLPLYELLVSQPMRWLIPYGKDYYDGHTGKVLRWAGHPADAQQEDTRTFATVTSVGHGLQVEAEKGIGSPLTAYDWARSEDPYLDDKRTRTSKDRAFTATPERRLSIRIRALHEPSAGLRLGGVVETVWRQLTGRAPAGWGTAEPVGNAWSQEDLTALARERMPEPTFFIVTGHSDHPAIATMRVARNQAGVEEGTSLTFGYRSAADVPDQDTLIRLAAELSARHGLHSMEVSHRAASSDLLISPEFQGIPAPLGMAVGPELTSAIGASATAPPGHVPEPVHLAPAAPGAYYYPLGGHPKDWQVLAEVHRGLAAAESHLASPPGKDGSR